jgi:hypothetical protein
VEAKISLGIFFSIRYSVLMIAILNYALRFAG